MPTLYASAISGNCWKVEVALRAAGVDYARREVDLTGARAAADRAALAALSPIARVPLLVQGDGRVQSESNALLLHYGEGTPLVPTEPFARTEVLRWMFFEQNLHEPSIATRRWWVRFAGREPEPVGLLDHWLARGDAALATMERHLDGADWFGPEGCSAADVALYAYTHVAEEGGFDLEPLPAVRAWLARFAERPGHFGLGG